MYLSSKVDIFSAIVFLPDKFWGYSCRDKKSEKIHFVATYDKIKAEVVMKRIFCMIMIMCLAFSFAACGGGNEKVSVDDKAAVEDKTIDESVVSFYELTGTAGNEERQLLVRLDQTADFEPARMVFEFNDTKEEGDHVVTHESKFFQVFASDITYTKDKEYRAPTINAKFTDGELIFGDDMFVDDETAQQMREALATDEQPEAFVPSGLSGKITIEGTEWKLIGQTRNPAGISPCTSCQISGFDTKGEACTFCRGLGYEF